MILHGYWQSGAVIQQNTPYKIWGWEEKTDTVSVTLIRESDSVVLEQVVAPVENGCFSAVLQPRPGSFDCYRLKICGNETITFGPGRSDTVIFEGRPLSQLHERG